MTDKNSEALYLVDDGREQEATVEYPPETSTHLTWAANKFIKAPTSRALDLTCLALFGTLVICFLLSAILDVDVTVHGNAEITADGGVKELVAPIDTVVSNVYKKAGDSVKEHELIMRFKMDGISVEQFQILADTVGRLTKDVENETSPIDLDLRTYTFTPDGIYESNVLQALANVEHSVHNFQADQLRSKVHAKVSTRSGSEIFFTNRRIEFLTERLDKMRASPQRRLLETYIDSTEEEIDRLRTQINSTVNRTSSALDLSFSELLRTLRIADGVLDDYRERHEIRSPVAGVVGKIVEGENVHVTVNKPVVTIIPANSQFVAHIRMKSKDLIKLKKGLPIYYKINAYPYQHFGLFTGEVLAFDQLKEPTKEGSTDDNFILNATINPPEKLKEDLRSKIKFYVGMSGEAVVVTGRTSIKNIMLDKFFNLKNGDD